MCKEFLSMPTALKASNGGPQWYSDNMMQTLIYLRTSWYFNRFHKQKCPGKEIIKATTWGPRDNILPPVVALSMNTSPWPLNDGTVLSYPILQDQLAMAKGK